MTRWCYQLVSQSPPQNISDKSQVSRDQWDLQGEPITVVIASLLKCWHSYRLVWSIIFIIRQWIKDNKDDYFWTACVEQWAPGTAHSLCLPDWSHLAQSLHSHITPFDVSFMIKNFSVNVWVGGVLVIGFFKDLTWHYNVNPLYYLGFGTVSL